MCLQDFNSEAVIYNFPLPHCSIFILKHSLTFDYSSISWTFWMEALCGADLTQLVSARFIFPPSTRARSVLSSAQTPWRSHQSIKSISVLCSLGGRWLAARMSSLSLLLFPPPAFASSLSANMSELYEACRCSPAVWMPLFN